jgi:ABC-type nitrate/sulfonate/bicarbonate transport system permease component
MTRGERAADIGWGLAGIALVLGLWELATRVGAIDPSIFPGPITAVRMAAGRLPASVFLDNMGWSLFRVTVGFALGAVTGTIVGFAAGWYRGFGYVARPLIELLRPIPPLAWIPLAIIWFGLGEPSKLFMVFLGAFFPVVTAAYHGITHIDPTLIRASRSFGLKGVAMLFHVGIPASAPDLATGIRVGWGLSFGVLVAAELIAADRGLGFMIMNERNSGGSVSVIIVGILLIGLLNLVSDAAIAAFIQRRIGRWHGA